MLKAESVLLRWYKSFNINYLGYDDRQPNVILRPWNALNSSSETAYRFIEIPLQNDVTTIVGANESGKSHLLSALSKVINGYGIPEADGKRSQFNVTDLCHYASIRDKNASGWPNIGTTFSNVDAVELSQIVEASQAKPPKGQCTEITLILAHDSNQEGVLYFGRDKEHVVPLCKDKLANVRKALPNIEFIQSEVPLASELPIDDLLANCTDLRESYVGFDLAQQAARLLAQIAFGADKKATDDVIDSVTSLQTKLKETPRREKTGTLEAQLFRDVIGVDDDAIKLLASIRKEDRGFAEGLVATWNYELDRKLNLRRFWQQDDQFSLSLDFKGGWFYFEIRDKTGSVYTFRERSSGLRFFLSYYIQAKSIESRYRDTGCIILMDEPDCFLSIAGQKNLLAVFESLVSPTVGNEKLQLVYTTHSPFLINANYPHRVRLVKKGDAEEGSQFIHESRLRRYEPVRSALGIDCAQTLFMGESNILLEGPSDQFIIIELIRVLTRSKQELPILDLSSTIVMSAESAPGVEKVLAASKWGDERIPATVVLFDSDDEGDKQKKRVTGKGKTSKLIEEKFVVQIAEVFSEREGDQKFVTTEDLFPSKLYANAVSDYVRKWYPDVFEKNSKQLDAALNKSTFSDAGNANGAQQVFEDLVFEKPRDYDKMGVAQHAIDLLASADSRKEFLQEIESNLNKLLIVLRRKIEQSKQESRKDSARQAVTRTTADFFKRFKDAAEPFEVELHLERLEREVDTISDDGATLRKALLMLLKEIRETRASGESMLKNSDWNRWSSILFAIKKNPLMPELNLDGDRVEPLNLWSPTEAAHEAEAGKAAVNEASVACEQPKTSA